MKTIKDKQHYRDGMRKCRENKQIKVNNLINEIWGLFPKGLQKCRNECMKDRLVNYGLHELNLNWHLVGAEDITDIEIGQRSLGLWYENEHTEVLNNKRMCDFSVKNIDFLQACDKLKVDTTEVQSGCMPCSHPQRRQGLCTPIRAKFVIQLTWGLACSLLPIKAKKNPSSFHN